MQFIMPTEAEIEQHQGNTKNRTETMETALHNIQQVQEKQTKQAMKTTYAEIKMGSTVLRYNARKKPRKGDTLEPDFFGPYTIT